MPLYDQVELLCQEILTQGKQEAEKIVSQAREKADQLVAAEEARGREAVRRASEEMRAQALLTARNLVDRAALESKRRIAEAKETLLGEIFKLGMERLQAFRHQADLVRGQKLPIFAMSGLPHHELAAQIVRQARLPGEEERFAIVFAAMGVQHDIAGLFRQSFEDSGVLNNVVMFLNLADDPAIERLITPRLALTVAEYLAFEKGRHILVVLTDMTNYCEALREVASSKGEVPSRKGYPGYLYSDLAALYERAGKIVTSGGSITQLPILTMPNDDITHPIPDLTGYITEGQIVLDRALHQRGIYPPINVLPSLSRLMSDGIGANRTRADHAHVASQLYAAYARVQRIQALTNIIGEDSLSPPDRQILKFGRAFEEQFIRQGQDENRDLTLTLDLAWKVLRELSRSELTRVTTEEISTFWEVG
jgi:V/A-type H+-transporting ATPase subunit B